MIDQSGRADGGTSALNDEWQNRWATRVEAATGRALLRVDEVWPFSAEYASAKRS